MKEFFAKLHNRARQKAKALTKSVVCFATHKRCRNQVLRLTSRNFARGLSGTVYKFNVLVMVLSMVWFAFGFNIAQANFNNNATSQTNSFSATSLVFTLTPTAGFTPVVTPTADSDRSITMAKTGSLNFNYRVRATNVSANPLCANLTLTAKLDGVTQYTGTISGFNQAPYTFAAPEVWDFTAHLTSSSAALQSTTCTFDITYNAWHLTETTGLTDTLSVSNTVTAGTWVVTPVTGEYSGSIIDSWIDEGNTGINHGTEQTFLVRSRDSGGNKDYRSLIKFTFNLPAGTTVTSANLKLMMTTAPSSSRTYQAFKATNAVPWTETGVTWANQPTLVASPTSSVSTGITDNVRLSWDVTADVQNFVATPANNNGWLIKDSVEGAGGSGVTGTFASRQNNTIDNRPVLEITFTPPPSSTNHLVVNEVYADVSGGPGAEPANEWVEIYNPTASAVNISGWKICDNTSCTTIPAATPVIPSLGFAVLSPNANTFSTHWPGMPAATVKVTLSPSNIGNGLANSGDRVYLQNSSSVTIDSMNYGSDTTFFTPSVAVPGAGNSLARIVKGYDNDIASDWVVSNTPNPGTNPSDQPSGDGTEVIRFTTEGIEIAATEEELPELPGEDVIVEEPVVNQPAPTADELVGPVNHEPSDGQTSGQTTEQPAEQEITPQDSAVPEDPETVSDPLPPVVEENPTTTETPNDPINTTEELDTPEQPNEVTSDTSSSSSDSPPSGSSSDSGGTNE